MTQEDKELLLKDLCARLPYYPECEMIDEIRVVNNEKNSSYTSTLFPKHIELFSYHNNFTIKPYLRPMSSMTEGERQEYNKFNDFGSANLRRYEYEDFILYIPSFERVDWLNAHHFDYRGLIPMGLALVASEGMYNLEKK